MRRFLLVFLMFVLPLQWAGAAIASVCEHEAQPAATAHVGHHAHEHHGPELQPQQADQPGDEALADHPDCGVCHGAGTPFVTADTAPTFAQNGRVRFAPYQAVIPDRSPDRLLRPPLALVS